MVSIVIIEDDKVWIDLLKEELEEKIHGCEIFIIYFESNAYQETIYKLNKIQPVLTIIDINMGGNSKAGIKLANRINKEIPTLNYVFLTSQKNQDPFIMKEASYTNAKAFFDKDDFMNDIDSLANYIKNNISVTESDSNLLVLFPLKINFVSRMIILNDEEIHFTKMEFEILELNCSKSE